MRRQGRGLGCRSGGWGRGRGAGPGRHSGGEDKDVRARLLQNTQAGPTPRAWVVGSSSSAESCPWRTGAREEPGPAPARAPNPASSPHFVDRKQGLREGKRPAREGTAARPRRRLRGRLCTRPGPAPALPAQRGVRTAAVPTRHPARRTATVSSTRERPFGLLLREISTREWEEIAPLSCPETNPLKAKAARCVRGEALES